MSKLLCKLDGGWEIQQDPESFVMTNPKKQIRWYFTSLDSLLRDAFNEGLKHNLKGVDNFLPALEEAKKWVSEVAASIPFKNTGRPLKRTNEFYTQDEKEVLRNDTFFA